jgi:hypothetical protein
MKPKASKRAYSAPDESAKNIPADLAFLFLHRNHGLELG